MLDLPSTLSLDSAPQVLKERAAGSITGLPLLCLGLAIVLGGVALTIHGGVDPLVEILVFLAGVLVLRGLVAVGPGQARVVQLFGRYTGTVRTPGLQWVNPFTTRRMLSTRIRNHETPVLKVNDADGNPIEMAAVVV